jgi:hypothetical protein
VAEYEREAFGWSFPGMSPAIAMRLARLEAAERAEEARRREEARGRYEDRYEHWRISRMQELAARGVPFNPADDNTLLLPLSELLERGFALQDTMAAQARREALRVAKEMGILDALGLPHVLSPAEVPAPTVHETSAPAKRAKFPRTVELLHRFRDKAPVCVCVDCVSVRAERAKAKEQR